MTSPYIPEVDYDHPDTLKDHIRHLAEADIDELRDLALALVNDLEAAYDHITELTTDDGRHIIEFRADGWTIMHPLACRPNLFTCPVNRAAERDTTTPPDVLGRFECGLGEDRFQVGDRIEAQP